MFPAGTEGGFRTPWEEGFEEGQEGEGRVEALKQVPCRREECGSGAMWPIGTNSLRKKEKSSWAPSHEQVPVTQPEPIAHTTPGLGSQSPYSGLILLPQLSPFPIPHPPSCWDQVPGRDNKDMGRRGGADL
ncbi:Lysine-specific demethylase 5A [Platysternon megacephalum]|uniref:Lysine-specific demethylase 5A n=1 Tax=Platysternon megacephalum TaxID=55544 RepID=A0A4D9DJ38_9SAUR|nr:Lysine-specific demethylase 5A [Platysternon megacephalum]